MGACLMKNKYMLPKLKIGEYSPAFPIIQGGMGVMISGPRLAAATASAGGIGTIASVGLAVVDDENRRTMNAEQLIMKNRELIAKYVRQAKEAAKSGIIAVNCMCALSDYEGMVKASCEAGADMIISGAGLPLKLPEFTKEFKKTALVPIVSSVKAASLIIQKWMRNYSRIPDAFVVETPNSAGGHLGAHDATQAEDKSLSLKEVVPALVKQIKEMGLSIPVIAAGGIWDGNDIKEAIEMGAAGVQMGTEFAATVEGDASDTFKQAYVNAKSEDVILLKSPCGLPGRAIRSPLTERAAAGETCGGKRCIRCLRQCEYMKKHETFCIADALVAAYKGDWNNGLFFCGSNVGKVKSIKKVKDLIGELTENFA